MMIKNLFLCFFLFTFFACSGTKVVNLSNKEEVQNLKETMELEYRDWNITANKMIDSMLKTRNFLKIENPVIAISDIKNDTMQRFDTDILIKKIRNYLVKSGQVKIATNFSEEDTTSDKLRKKRNNDEYNIKTIAKKNTLIAPNLSLSGKMIQRNLNIKTSWLDTKDTRTEYYLQLTLTDLETGLSIWEDEHEIIKEGRKLSNW